MKFKKVFQPRSNMNSKFNQSDCKQILDKFRQELEFAEDDTLINALNEIEAENEAYTDINYKKILDTLILKLTNASAYIELLALNSIMLDVFDMKKTYF